MEAGDANGIAHHQVGDGDLSAGDPRDKFVDKFLEDVCISHCVFLVMHHRNKPLLIQPRRQQHSPVNTVDPLRKSKVKIGRFVISVVPHGLR